MIKLYQIPFNKEQRALIEALPGWLRDNEPVIQEDQRYIKHGLQISVVMNLPQESGRVLNYNYVTIDNEDGDGQWNYWITDTAWTGKDTIRLILELDVINTFAPVAVNFSAKTLIIRQHLDRFEKATSIQKGDKLTRIINTTVEAPTPTLFKTLKEPILQKNYPEGPWYLIYRTATIPTSTNFDEKQNPVSVYLLNEKSLKLNVSNTNGIFMPSDLKPGWTYLYYIPYNTPNCEFKFTKKDESTETTFVLQQQEQSTDYVLVRVGDKNDFDIEFLRYIQYTGEVVNYAVGDQKFGVYKSQTNTSINFSVASGAKKLIGTLGTYTKVAPQLILQGGVTTQIDFVNASNTTIPYASFDRTDSRLIRIISIPYCPIQLTSSPEGWILGDGAVMSPEQLIQIPSGSTFKEKFIDKISLPFTYTLDTEVADRINETRDIVDYTVASPSFQLLKQLDRESKLFHSAYYVDKIVYDSSNIIVQLEKFDRQDGFLPEYYNVNFKAGDNFQSVFGFYIDFDRDVMPLEEQDFQNYMICTRNNEMPIFSSDYINYMRYNYDYDVTTTGMQIASNWTNAGVNAANSLLAGDLLKEGGLAKIGILGGISLGASIVSSVATQAINTKLAWMSIDQRQKELQAQSVGITGSADYDMFAWYSGNYIQHFIYEPHWTNKAALEQLFFYQGYSCNYVAIPNISSRYWFNYLQCEPIFVQDVARKVPNIYLEALTEAFKNGITIYHYHDGWNSTQDKENYEIWLVQ